MKKGISFLCALTMLFALTACGGQGSDTDTPSAGNSSSRPVDESQSSLGESQDAESPAEGGKALVAYFSATGNTKGIAEQIAGLTGGDLYEIIPAEPYTDEDLDYSDSQSRASLEMDDPDARPEISSEAISISEYAVLYLGYPIWHGQAPRILSKMCIRDMIGVHPNDNTATVWLKAEDLVRLIGEHGNRIHVVPI